MSIRKTLLPCFSKYYNKRLTVSMPNRYKWDAFTYEKVIKARDRDTVVCGTATGHPVRAIHNKFTRSYLQSEKAGISKEDLEEMGRGRYPAAAVNGELEAGTILAGQICGLVNKVQPAAEIVCDIINDAGQVYRRLEGLQCQD